MTVIDNPIINSPFREPAQHHELDDRGSPTGAIRPTRRKSTYLTPVPQPKKQRGAQMSLFEGTAEKVEENQTINAIRQAVKLWRERGYPGVTRVTRALLDHWNDPRRERKLFFCQIEALETIIYITEAAKRERQGWIEDELRRHAAEANPGLFRLALKMATGSGKTVVMAMLIAWHTLNKIANSGDARFSDAFLIVAPGVTIRDRLRVLLPNDPENYYRLRDLVPPAQMDQLFRARIVIANFHAFMPREIVEASALAKTVLAKGGANPFTETPGQMVRRVCRGLDDAKNIIVINDEAHHCYARRQDATDTLTGEVRQEVEERRVWVNGIQAVADKLGVKAVYDLSATPFFLAGSGYPEGKLFPWVVSDFALIDAIESGIVKIPRLPVADDTMQGDLPMYRTLWTHIRDGLSRKALAANAPEHLPRQLQTALLSLYGNYEKVHALWEEQTALLGDGGAANPPPVLIVVCSNTLVSRMVYEWISGYTRDYGGTQQIAAGNLPLFRNEDGDRWHPRPTTILVDSQQLESGEAMSDDFKRIAAREIDAYKADYRRRYPDRDPDDLTDSDLLREVMNTVGKRGRLGEQVKCVVSVSMLTEGWDCNTVTHILGVRAFSTQLICEQVVGRALRRVSYEADADGMFEPEYAEVYGVPFSFIPASGSTKSPKLPKTVTRIQAFPERAGAAFRFPNVIGYRYDLDDQPLDARFDSTSEMILSSQQIPTMTITETLFGQGQVHTLDALYARRKQEVAFLLAKYVLERWFVGGLESEPKVWYFPQILAIVQRWLRDGDGYVRLKDGCKIQLLLVSENAHSAAEKIYRAIIAGMGSQVAQERLTLLTDPAAPVGSSETIDFETRKDVYRTDPRKCQVNYVPIDSGWEGKMVQVLETMPEVIAYVKNEGMELTVPYAFEGADRSYIPDFLVRVDRGGGREPLNLIVEVTGEREQRRDEKDAKLSTMRTLWLPGVNAIGTFGQWDYIEITDPWDAMTAIRRAIAAIDLTTRHS